MADSNSPIIFFDGVCNLCNRFVDFVIRHDKSARFRFAPLQGEAAEQLLGSHPARLKLHSVVLWHQGEVWEKSDAALRILRMLPDFSFAGIGLLLPGFLRNTVYDMVAQSRYRIFGKRDMCRLPTDEERERFLS